MCTKTRGASKVRTAHPSYKISRLLRDAGNIPQVRPGFGAVLTGSPQVPHVALRNSNSNGRKPPFGARIGATLSTMAGDSFPAMVSAPSHADAGTRAIFQGGL